VKLEAFLKPESIAVIGASRDPEKAGHKIFRNLLESGYVAGKKMLQKRDGCSGRG